MKIFSENDLSQFLEARLQQVAREVASEEPNRLLGMNETQYVEYLTAQARVEPLAFDWAGCSISDSEQMPVLGGRSWWHRQSVGAVRRARRRSSRVAATSGSVSR